MHSLMRGKDKVLGEESLAFMSYNLGRAMSVLGFEGLMDNVKRGKSPNILHLILRRFIETHKSNISYIYVCIHSAAQSDFGLEIRA